MSRLKSRAWCTQVCTAGSRNIIATATATAAVALPAAATAFHTSCVPEAHSLQVAVLPAWCVAFADSNHVSPVS
jgi:hypothetical protein